MQAEPVELDTARGRRVFRGVVYALLALGQLVFVFVFIFRFYIISQSERMTIDSRWFVPLIALASLLAFAVEVWKSFVRGKGITHQPNGGRDERRPGDGAGGPGTA
jgi:tellurite resistance protein TehA-like permease